MKYNNDPMNEDIKDPQVETPAAPVEEATPETPATPEDQPKDSMPSDGNDAADIGNEPGTPTADEDAE